MGVEQPTNARLAHEAGATSVGFSFASLRPRLPKKSRWIVADRLSQFDFRYVASGGHSASKKLSAQGAAEYVEQYETFVEENADAISLCTEYDGPLSPVELGIHRMKMVAMLGDKFVPVWQENTGPRGLDALAESFRTVGVLGADVKENRVLASKMVPLTNRLGTRWHALDGARPDDLMTGRFSSAATLGWLSPMKWGEVIVWDGSRMVRYHKDMADQAKRRHRSTFRLAGFDAEAILRGDHNEISRFTVWSYARLEAAVSRRNPTPDNPFSDAPETNVVPLTPRDPLLSTSTDRNEADLDLEHPPADVDSSALVVRNSHQLPTPRERREILPGVRFETKTSTEYDSDGNQVLVERQLFRKSSVPLRACDSCHIAATCPGFQPGSECVYDLPVEIKTKDQILAVNYALLEMQVERVAFMRLAEEQSGGYADPNLSLEMDRVFEIQKRIKDIEDNAEYIKINMEARGGAGVLSRLLGEKTMKQAEVAAPSRPVIEAKVIDG